jgi:hypothetical protein
MTTNVHHVSMIPSRDDWQCVAEALENATTPNDMASRLRWLEHQRLKLELGRIRAEAQRQRCYRERLDAYILARRSEAAAFGFCAIGCACYVAMAVWTAILIGF